MATLPEMRRLSRDPATDDGNFFYPPKKNFSHPSRNANETGDTLTKNLKNKNKNKTDDLPKHNTMKPPAGVVSCNTVIKTSPSHVPVGSKNIRKMCFASEKRSGQTLRCSAERWNVATLTDSAAALTTISRAGAQRRPFSSPAVRRRPFARRQTKTLLHRPAAKMKLDRQIHTTKKVKVAGKIREPKMMKNGHSLPCDSHQL